MMRYILIAIFGVMLVGCSVTTPSKSEFRMNPDIPTKKYNVVSCKDNSLQVAQAFSSNTLMSKDMSYAQGDSKQYVYSKSQWATSPNQEITDIYLRVLRSSDIFKSVQTSKSRSRSDYILEINIEDFMQYFNEETSNSYANVLITLSFIDAKTNLVFATKTFNSKVDVESLDADGGVKSLNIALSDVIKQSSEWFVEVCR